VDYEIVKCPSLLQGDLHCHCESAETFLQKSKFYEGGTALAASRLGIVFSA